jgi:hypothetical protein
LRKFACFSLLRWDHPHEKCPSTRAAFACTPSISPDNCPESDRIRLGISNWTGFQSRGSCYFGLERSQSEQHRRIGDGMSISVITCVSPAGKSLIPSMITLQNVVPVREQLKKYGIGFGTDLVLKSNHIRTVLVSDLTEQRWLDASVRSIHHAHFR